MPDENVTIKITADTSGYSEGLSKAEDANKGFEAQTKGIRDKMRKGWDQVSERIGLSAKKAGQSMAQSTGQASKGMSKALAGGAIVAALKVALKGVVGGLAAMAVMAVTDAMGKSAMLFDPALVERQANKMNSAFLKVKTTIGAIISPLYTIATNVLSGIANGINSALEGVVQVYGFIVGLVGATGAISRNATEWSESMESATASANAGLAAFDKLTTLNMEGMGDEAQAQRIRNLMADAAESGNSLRETISQTLDPLNMVGNFFANLGLERAWEGFTKSAVRAWSTVSELGSTVWAGITTWASTSWGQTVSDATKAWGVISKVAGTLWDELSGTVSAKLSAMFGPALEGAKNLAGAIGSGIDTLMAIDLSETWGRMSEGFRTAWTTLSTFAGNTFGAVFGPVKETVGEVFSAMSRGVSTLVDGLVRGLSTIPDRLSTLFTSVWDGMAGGVKGVANGIITVFNKVIGAYNSSIGKLRIENDWLGINIGFPTMASIPMLATGGIAEPNDPFLAILGDNKKEREFVTPESTMRDVVRSVIEEQGGVRQTIEIPISLDGRIMARATYDYYAREAKRRGATWY